MRETFNQLEQICNYYYDAINDYHYFSNQIIDMLKIKTENDTPTLSFNHFLQYVHSEDKERVKKAFEDALNERKAFQIEYRIVRIDKTTIVVREQTGILLDSKGNLEGLVGIIQDITENTMLEDLLDKQTQINEIYDNPDVGIWSKDLKYENTMKVSKGIEYISGYTKEDFENGLQWESIVHKEDLQNYLENQIKLPEGNIIHNEYRIINKMGDRRWVQDYVIPTLDSNGNIVGLNGLITEITEKKVLEEKIEYLANNNTLTDLPNVNSFNRELEKTLIDYQDSSKQFAIVNLDINGFRYINNTLGNKVGDELLKEFPKRIKSYLSLNDFVAHKGGDEFILLIKEILSFDALKGKINQMIECLNQPFNINGYQLFVTSNIGVCTYPENGTTIMELMRNASLALRNAIKKGKGTYHILSHKNSIQSFTNYTIGTDFKNALENNEIVVYYQPRVDTQTNQITGAEALIRWKHPKWGLISPGKFLNEAEENGLLTEMDEWLLKEVCSQIKFWNKSGKKTVPISINISAIQLMKPDWPSKVAETIKNTGINTDDIELEITESIILNNSDMVKNTLSKLKELGIKLILDGFGKGEFSLSYLTNYPFDGIKIEKSLIRKMHNSKQNLHLVKTYIYG